jgi:hypothetical protein
MKNQFQQNPDKNIHLDNKKKRPEVRDDLDHREGEEQDFKGDDVTHNKKETKSRPKKSKT